MAERHHRIGQGITPGAEPSSDGEKELEEFGEYSVSHLWAPSLMMVMNLTENLHSSRIEIIIKRCFTNSQIRYVASWTEISRMSQHALMK